MWPAFNASATYPSSSPTREARLNGMNDCTLRISSETNGDTIVPRTDKGTRCAGTDAAPLRCVLGSRHSLYQYLVFRTTLALEPQVLYPGLFLWRSLPHQLDQSHRYWVLMLRHGK